MSELINKMIRNNPIISFSVYTNTQVQTIKSLGKEILDLLDSPKFIEGNSILDIYCRFWLWVLGSYEILRTMSQAKKCFTLSFHKKLTELKKEIHLLRIPFSKQEYPGRKRPIENEASISSIDTENKDFKFNVGSSIISIRDCINKFDSFFNNIKSEDILFDHRESYRDNINTR